MDSWKNTTKTNGCFYFCPFFIKGHPTEMEYIVKTIGYSVLCLTLTSQKMYRRPKTGTSDGNALQVV